MQDIDTNRKEKGNKAIILFFAIILCMIFASVYLPEKEINDTVRDKETIQLINTGWILSDGEKEDTIELGQTIETTSSRLEITKTLKPEETTGTSIYFGNERQRIEVYADGEKIFAINDGSVEKTLQVKGCYLLSLPRSEKGYELKLIYEGLNGTCSLSDMWIGSKYELSLFIISKERLTFIALILLFVCAAFLFMYMILKLMDRKIDKRIFSLFCLSVLFLIWGYTDSAISSIAELSPEGTAIVSYFAFMMMSVPVLFFADLSFERKYRAITWVEYGYMIGIVLELLLGTFGIRRFNDMLGFNHAGMILSIACSLYYSLMNKRELKNKSSVCLFQGNIVMAVSIFFALIIYWAFGTSTYRGIVLFMTIVFILNFWRYVYYSYYEKEEERIKQQKEKELYEELSMHDSLTGLKNRRSLELQMKAIEAAPEHFRDAIIVMMDLNGLKNANDEYGHAYGDELLIWASKVICDAFGEKYSYRISGDEFAAIIPEAVQGIPWYKNRFYECLKKANEESNSNHSIASGFSSFYDHDEKPKSIFLWKQDADIRMYKNKKMLHSDREYTENKKLRTMIESVEKVVRAKDDYTAHHEERVGKISQLIAEKMGLSDNTVIRIRDAAEIHDIGKIGIPDAVLLKPGKLTKEEYDVMKKHCTIGADIITTVPDMTEIADIIRHHHEKYDGNGYPDGLTADQIPIEARIIAVADSIDAMTSRRCYRKALAPDVCREEIKKNTGKMYDPAIVEIVMDHWNEIEKILFSDN